MNDGLITKTFIASGSNSEKALTRFVRCWNHGFVEAIYAPHPISENFCAIEVAKNKLTKDFNFMVIDNDAASIQRATEYFNHIKQVLSKVSILGIIMIDSIETTSNEELSMLCEKLAEVTDASFIQVNHCSPQMIEPLIAMYAHLYCGFSVNCLELQDLSDTLKSGYHFEASEVDAATIYELPFAAYQAANKISLAANKLSEAQGLVLIIISNEEFTDLSILTACIDILKGYTHKDINVVFHTNIQPENGHSIHLGAVFNALRKDEQVDKAETNENTLNIPQFLR